jgi:hypothetical protein
MKTLNRLLLAAALLGSATPTSLAAAPAEPTAGKVLVLHNESTMEGDIQRIGDQYRVRHSLGETWLRTDGALRLCADYQEALAFVRSRANLDDADERLRLSRWCRDHGLRREMLDEVRAAVQLRPGDAEARRILEHLELDANRPLTAPPPPEPVEAPPSPAFEVSAEAVGQFSARVQPILMNACAQCHATGKGGAFRLTRAYDAVNRRATQANLAAVLAQVNAGQPSASPFLAKAISLHGEMAEAPFKNRQATAFRTLEDWVCLTVRTNPQLRGEPGAGPPAPVILPSPTAAPAPVASTGSFGEERTGVPNTGRPQAGNSVPPPPPSSQVVTPTATEPDAFDPDEFNRQNRLSPPRP